MVETKFATEKLAKGIYSLKITADGYQVTKKVVVQ
jgi:hypothetical protein